MTYPSKIGTSLSSGSALRRKEYSPIGQAGGPVARVDGVHRHDLALARTPGTRVRTEGASTRDVRVPAPRELAARPPLWARASPSRHPQHPL
eukprot:10271953-Heterocapsa_arctica.AAC.2